MGACTRERDQGREREREKMVRQKKTGASVLKPYVFVHWSALICGPVEQLLPGISFPHHHENYLTILPGLKSQYFWIHCFLFLSLLLCLVEHTPSYLSESMTGERMLPVQKTFSFTSSFV